jgi:cation diffusion facilitator family transporter
VVTDETARAGRHGIRAAQAGVLVNAFLAALKLVAGIVGNSGALVADAVESIADVFGSLLVWGGLHVATLPADENHPYGHGKAEALAGAAVALLLMGAAAGIALDSVRQIRTPHEYPAAWTLAVLVAVVVVKWLLSRRVHAVGADIGSTAVKADAWHHMSDAVTSAAAFVGISVALWGRHRYGTPAWAGADDWAALVAAAVIGVNGWLLLRPALDDLMDRMPGDDVMGPVRAAALSVPGVEAVESLFARKVGLGYRVTIHVQADPAMTLHDAHELAGRVKYGILRAVPRVQSVLVHMEPFEGGTGHPG